MNKTIIKVVAVMIIMVMFAPMVQAGELDYRLDFEARKLEYEDNKKTPLIAPALSYFIPTAGHFYAGDWSRGLKFPVMTLGGLLLGTVGSESGNDGMALAGAGIAIGSHVWELFDAYDTAKDYNENLKRELRISPTYNINNNTVGAKIDYSF